MPTKPFTKQLPSGKANYGYVHLPGSQRRRGINDPYRYDNHILSQIQHAVEDSLADAASEGTPEGEDPSEELLRENAWTIAIDKAHGLGLDGEEAIAHARRACELAGYGRNADSYEGTREKQVQSKVKGRQKSLLAGALKTLGFKSFADAVNTLGFGDLEPSEIEQRLIARAEVEVESAKKLVNHALAEARARGAN